VRHQLAYLRCRLQPTWVGIAVYLVHPTEKKKQKKEEFAPGGHRVGRAPVCTSSMGPIMGPRNRPAPRGPAILPNLLDLRVSASNAAKFAA